MHIRAQYIPIMDHLSSSNQDDTERLNVLVTYYSGKVKMNCTRPLTRKNTITRLLLAKNDRFLDNATYDELESMIKRYRGGDPRSATFLLKTLSALDERYCLPKLQNTTVETDDDDDDEIKFMGIKPSFVDVYGGTISSDDEPPYDLDAPKYLSPPAPDVVTIKTEPPSNGVRRVEKRSTEFHDIPSASVERRTRSGRWY